MNRTSRPSGKTKMDLTPLPLRVSEMSITRLHALRQADGVTIQEHVRRAIDDYLDRKEMLVADLARVSPTSPPAMKATGGLSPSAGPPVVKSAEPSLAPPAQAPQKAGVYASVRSR